MALYRDLIVKFYGAIYGANFENFHSKYTWGADLKSPSPSWQAIDDAAQGLLEL